MAQIALISDVQIHDDCLHLADCPLIASNELLSSGRSPWTARCEILIYYAACFVLEVSPSRVQSQSRGIGVDAVTAVSQSFFF